MQQTILMNKKMTNRKPTEEKLEVQSKAYRRPELKKHGKLKSTARDSVVVYTTYYVL
jgi:hypothetical protein